MSQLPLKINSKLLHAIQSIESSLKRIAIVVNEEGLIIGTVTDGDIRRCLLKGGNMETSITEVMNSSPVIAHANTKNEDLLMAMNSSNITSIPLIDDQGKLKSIIHINELKNFSNKSYFPSKFSFALIMAGGEGLRLRPITSNIPKPMLEIGGISILERQINQLSKFGINQIYISVNYLSHLIENHFGDGSKFGVKISYIRETEKLGTAGALSLIKEKPENSFLLINGDILTTINLENLYLFHNEHNSYITMTGINYRISIPYGVITFIDSSVKSVEEKPEHNYLCNAGIYAISPELLSIIRKNVTCNMTDIIDDCLKKNLPVSVFPLYEYWSDIGTPQDLTNARKIYDLGVLHDK